MNIVVFKDKESLAEFLPSFTKTFLILDYTKSDYVKNIAPDNVVTPISFTPEQRHKIIDEYIELISELGGYNSFSIQWLCHPISEKNDLVPDNLLDQLIDFLTFFHAYSRIENKTLIVLTSASSLIKSIREFSSEKRVDCRLIPTKSLDKKTIIFPTALARKTLSFFKGFLSSQYRFMKSHFLWRKIDKKQSYTVLRTWFDSRSQALVDKSEDVYFGTLPKYLKNNGRNILYFGEFSEGFEHEFDNLKGDYQNPVILERSLINGFHHIKAFFFQKSVGRKIQLKTGLEILNINIDIVLKNYFKNHVKSSQIRINYLSYLSVTKLAKRLNIDCYYLPFENYAWEKLTHMAITHSRKKIKTIAFQHAQVAQNSTKFFLGKRESAYIYLPDKIITLGDFTRRFLVERKNYPAELMVTGCALRQNYSIPDHPVDRKSNCRIMVKLWSFEKSVQMMEFLNLGQRELKKYDILIDPHPCHPLEKIIPRLSFQYKNAFNLSNGYFVENLKESDLLVYHGTTACMDALAHGLPLINVEFDDFISPDPLFAFSDFKWTATRPEELAEVIEKIYALSNEEYYERQKKGFDFVKTYLFPVNEENLKNFLI